MQKLCSKALHLKHNGSFEELCGQSLAEIRCWGNTLHRSKPGCFCAQWQHAEQTVRALYQYIYIYYSNIIYIMGGIVLSISYQRLKSFGTWHCGFPRIVDFFWIRMFLFFHKTVSYHPCPVPVFWSLCWVGWPVLACDWMLKSQRISGLSFWTRHWRLRHSVYVVPTCINLPVGWSQGLSCTVWGLLCCCRPLSLLIWCWVLVIRASALSWFCRFE